MKRFLLLCLFVPAFSSAVLAQKYEISPVFGWFRPSAGVLGSLDETNPKNDDTRMKPDTGYGVRLTLNTPGYYGFELAYLRSRARLQAKVRHETGGEILREDRIQNWTGSLNFLAYMMPARERFRPFMTAGFQVLDYGRPDIPEWTRRNARTFGFNYGGGIKIQFAPHLQLRLDARDFIGGKPYDLTFEEFGKLGGRFRHFEGTAGIGITF